MLRNSTGCRAVGNQDADTKPIENLSREYCDNFVCTSSPAVETTIRSLARDIELRLKYSSRLFQPDATYTDGVRSFKGSNKYDRATWAGESLGFGKGTLTRIEMLDKATVRINWRMSGKFTAFDVDIPVESVFEMNVLTGRVISHRETYDVGSLSPPAAAAVTASRLAWSARQGSQDASDELDKVGATLPPATVQITLCLCSVMGHIAFADASTACCSSCHTSCLLCVPSLHSAIPLDSVRTYLLTKRYKYQFRGVDLSQLT